MTTKELIKKLKVCTKYYEKNHKVIRNVSTPVSYFLLKEVVKRLEELDKLRLVKEEKGEKQYKETERRSLYNPGGFPRR